ncbi:MAG: MATE family efflux transporter [Planctomycetia bacterium]|nr:MATE family efflux transporter [Planctomycetia bacterium]
MSTSEVQKGTCSENTDTCKIAGGSDLHQFFRYTIPTMFFMFVGGLYNIADGIFVGKATGETGLAACLVTFPIYCVLFALGDMIGVGGAILIARYRGEGRPEMANRIYSAIFGLVLLLYVGLLVIYALFGREILIFSGATPEILPLSAQYFGIVMVGCFPMLLWVCLASVLRSDDRPSLSSWLMVLGAVGNIILDYVFIMRWGYGVPGAAIATVVAECFPLICGFFYFFSPYCRLKFQFRDMFPSWHDAWEICRCGIPSFGAQSAVAVMLLCHNLQALRWGGDVALAAYASICMIESLASMIMQGIASGLQPLVSYYYGARDFVRNRRFLRYGLVFSFLVGVLGALFSVLVCKTLPLFMGLEGETAEIATRGLLISAPAFLGIGIVKTGSYYYQATERIVAASILIYGDCIILPLCLFLLPFVFGLDGVWMAMAVSRFILVVILILLAIFPWFRKKMSLYDST